MAKTIRPTNEEKEIIRGIFKSPEEYSVIFKTGEIFYNGISQGEIRRKFIPFGYQYQHDVVNVQKKNYRKNFRCPYSNECERYKSKLDSMFTTSFDKIISDVMRRK